MIETRNVNNVEDFGWTEPNTNSVGVTCENGMVYVFITDKSIYIN